MEGRNEDMEMDVITQYDNESIKMENDQLMEYQNELDFEQISN